MENTGVALSLNGNSVFSGGNTHNGFLSKNHSFDLTIGYSKLTIATGVPAKFGFGVFQAANDRDGKITTVKPGTNPQPLGVLISNAFIRQGQPAAPDTVNDYNKSLVAVRGYVRYKTGYTTAGVESQAFADITKGMYLMINDLNGQPHFDALNVVTGFTCFGKVILLDPDVKGWWVEITA